MEYKKGCVLGNWETAWSCLFAGGTLATKLLRVHLAEKGDKNRIGVSKERNYFQFGGAKFKIRINWSFTWNKGDGNGEERFCVLLSVQTNHASVSGQVRKAFMLLSIRST